MKQTRRIALLMIAILLLTAGICFAARVVSEGHRVYIIDRTGERWDVTQARERSFIPQKFQHGIGKSAFIPLRDEDFADVKPSEGSNMRIIGISIDDNAHAYTVNRLRHHEIANTSLAGEAIVAAY